MLTQDGDLPKKLRIYGWNGLGPVFEATAPDF